MIVELSSVGTIPKDVKAKFSPSDIDLEDAGRLTNDVLLQGKISRDERGVHFAGKIESDVEIDCSRCLEPKREHLSIEFEDVFIDESEESDAAEVEVDPDRLDESILESGSIDLGEVVREQILLELPDQAFCREECKGLCPICGGNRNLIDCNCSGDETDPRWAGLKNLI